jgi:hypothetical protein
MQLIIDTDGSYDPRVFLMEAPRQSETVQCYIRRKKATNKLLASEYYLYAEDNAGEYKRNQLMMVAKKIAWGKTCAFHISMNEEEVSSTAANFLGEVQSNFVGTEWTVRGHVMCQADEREDLGVVLYDTNVLGSKGPRCMRVYVPRVDEIEYTPEEEGGGVVEEKEEEKNEEEEKDEEEAGEEDDEEGRGGAEEEGGGGGAAEHKGKGKGKSTAKKGEGKKPRITSKRRAWVPTRPNGEDGMLQKVRETAKEEPAVRSIDGLSCYINKPPRWNDHVGAYVLNFHGRVTKASVKNFQLVTDEHEQGDRANNATQLDDIALMFGRRGDNEFAMDYRWPMSAFQAFAIAITSCNSKLACE